MTINLDLSDGGVAAILDALDAADITVYEHESDGDHYIDLHLRPITGRTYTVLSWCQDGLGWRVTECEETGRQIERWLIGHVSLADVVRETAAILGVTTELTRSKTSHPATGSPCWSVTGPHGTIRYDLLGNHLQILPAVGERDSGVRRLADEVRAVVQAGGDDAVWLVLERHYELLLTPAGGGR